MDYKSVQVQVKIQRLKRAKYKIKLYGDRVGPYFCVRFEIISYDKFNVNYTKLKQYTWINITIVDHR